MTARTDLPPALTLRLPRDPTGMSNDAREAMDLIWGAIAAAAPPFRDEDRTLTADELAGIRRVLLVSLERMECLHDDTEALREAYNRAVVAAFPGGRA